MDTAPVALFVYNRPWHTKRTLDALRSNDFAAETDLFVFSDGPRDQSSVDPVRAVRLLLRDVTDFRSVTVVEHESNLGLAQSIIYGVTRVCKERGNVIVVEDDLVTSTHFLRFMNDGLQKYASESKVGSIHGYWYPTDVRLPDTFFLEGASCWGWATWDRAWRVFEPNGHILLRELARRELSTRFDLDGAISYSKMLRDQVRGRNDSWAIRWHASTFLAGLLQLSPARSLVTNIGFDGTGTHCATSSVYDVQLATRPIELADIELMPSQDARDALKSYHISTRTRLPARAARLVRKFFGF